VTTLKAPFPYFGGKSKIAPRVWEAFGDIKNYVEPFFGSGACLLAAPWPADRIETVNDKDGMVSNFWRALQKDPEQVAHFADWPVNENDLHARHYWLTQQRESLQAKLEGDPEYCDTKIAGWWVWGICAWIGREFCNSPGPWVVRDGELINTKDGDGISRYLPHLGNAGRGINRILPHLGDAGQGIKDYFTALAERLRRVRICCGDWSRVVGPSVTFKHGLTGVFLDPPYSDMASRSEVYSTEDLSVAHKVREWAIANGDNPLMRIVLCGYEGEHNMPDDWTVTEWSANGGYDGQRKNGKNNNKHRERLWLSPHCLKEKDLFSFQNAYLEATKGVEAVSKRSGVLDCLETEKRSVRSRKG